MRFKNIKVGSKVKIDHPFYNVCEVVVTDVDEDKRTGDASYGCKIDNDNTWFDEDMIIRVLS